MLKYLDLRMVIKKVYTDDKVIAFPNNNELAKTGFIGAFLISALANLL